MAERKIVVGIDFSEYSDIALAQATWLAGQTAADLALVHVGAPPLRAAGSLLAFTEVWQKLIEQRTADDGLTAKNLAERITSQGVQATHRIVHGDPAERLVKVANDEGANFLVVGTHGLTGVRAFLLGSAAQGVVRQARCNVLVARSSENWGTGPKRILVATDFTAYAEEALRAAVALAPDDATIDVVHCWQLPVPAAPPAAYGSGFASLGTLAEDLQASAQEHGKVLIKKFASSRLNLRFEVFAGPSAATVIDHAKREAGRYDLIVTGSHGRRGFRRFFLGSVAETIVRHAPCSVLVVHRQAEEKQRASQE
jgi:nucleotide-binding universal stress UspA family protein